MYSMLTVLKGCELPGGQGTSREGIDGGNSVEGSGDHTSCPWDGRAFLKGIQ